MKFRVILEDCKGKFKGIQTDCKRFSFCVFGNGNFKIIKKGLWFEVK
jgi:hypothetical protein